MDEEHGSGGSEREFERLSKAITDAVMTSENVKKIVAEIQKKEKICPQSFMVLVLKMQVLTESLEMEVEEEFLDNPPPKKSARKKSRDLPQYIDGNRLSKKEIEFQEFSKKKFDTEDWLRKNGLSF
ncbi:hypothetical protein MNBD_NITROSPINAE05-1475 [hydrothermal vent metagenome]|uniref:Uncharacterized protein n=1 Tax=hydrothermal vent metagenome TaxID=652676 RepID=A0A3B1D2J3_9ZZZZ